MPRKRIEIMDGKKLCRGKNGCGQLLPIDKFDKQLDIYYLPNCRDCRNRTNKKYRKPKGKAAHK